MWIRRNGSDFSSIPKIIINSGPWQLVLSMLYNFCFGSTEKKYLDKAMSNLVWKGRFTHHFISTETSFLIFLNAVPENELNP